MSKQSLHGIQLFAPLDAAQREALVSLFKPRLLKNNEAVFWIGDKGTEFFIIRHGRINICYPDGSGKEVSLAILGPGQFFGEISLLDGGPRTATARAIGEGELLSLDRGDFHDFLLKNPAAAVHMLTVLGSRQRETVDRLRGIKNVNEAVAERQSRWHRASEYIASMTATEAYLLLNLMFLGGWVVLNVVLLRLHKDAFDAPPSFGTLGFLISVEALFITLFVLISQSRQSDRDRIRADLDYQVNVKAHLEVMHLHQKLDRLLAAVEPPKPAAKAPEGA